MPLRMLEDDEVHDLEIGGTTFRYRKLPHGLAVELTRRHTKRGRLDEEAMERDTWEHVLAGWDDLLDKNGVPVQFEPRRAHDVAQRLPNDVANMILARAREPELYVHEALGNSEPSSVSV